MSIFSVGKKILYKYPQFLGFISTIYNLCSRNSEKIKGKNNKISKSKSFFKRCKIKIIGNNNKIIFGEMSYFLNTNISIYGNNNTVYIGNKVYVNNGDFYLEDDNNNLTINSKTTFAGYTHLALTEGTRIIIGEDCLFSNNIVFRTGDSHSILDINGNRTNFAKDIVISNHVWLTQNVTVLKGSTIADNSIIATGSIVTKQFNNNNCLIAGNPAKVIKMDVNWCHERK